MPPTSNRKARGYRVERKIRQRFESDGWRVIRAGASLGEADLVCLNSGTCLLLQIKSTKKKVFYYYEYSERALEKFPFYLVVDFGYGKIRVLHPEKKVLPQSGETLEEFLGKFKSRESNIIR